jgi:hypothetical protein
MASKTAVQRVLEVGEAACTLASIARRNEVSYASTIEILRAAFDRLTFDRSSGKDKSP